MGSSGDYSRLQRLLIIKIAAIGDVAGALPLLTFFRGQNPAIEITWVCGEIAAPLVAATGLVDKLVMVDEKKLFRGSLLQKGREVVTVWKKLLPDSFDLVLTAHPDPRFRLFSALLCKKEHRYFCRKQKRPTPVAGRYRTEEYLRLAVEENCYIPVFPELKCSLPEHLRAAAAKAPVALAPGGAKNMLREDALRRWPIEHYVTLAKELTKRGIPVAVTGAESDTWVLPHFAGLNFENLIGKTTLLDLVAFYRECRLLITHDSGPLHLARLAPCRTLALFGPTNPREFVGDSPDVLWGGKSLGCSPCYDGKTYALCQNNLCMKKITPQEVLLRVESALRTDATSIPCMQAFETHRDSNPR